MLFEDLCGLCQIKKKKKYECKMVYIRVKVELRVCYGRLPCHVDEYAEL